DFTDLGSLVVTLSQDLNDPAGTPFPEGVQNFKLEVEDRAGNISPDFLLDVEFDSLAATPSIDLIDSSDTGNDDQDNVTNLTQPAFSGLAEADATIRVFATNVATGVTQLVGDGVVGSDLSDVPPPTVVINGVSIDGLPDDGLGIWEVTVEPLADGSYDIVVESEDAAGNVTLSEPLQIWVDTIAPNTPYLDLISDSGRDDADDVTNVNNPVVTVTIDDTIDGDGNPFWHDVKYRLYDRPGDAATNGEVLLVESWTALPGFTTGGFFTHTLSQVLNDPTGPALADGVHNLKLEVEDRAGNFSADFLLTITIDTVAPPVNIIGIDPAATDTGVTGQPDTFVDRITSDTATGFVGRAEADAIVRLYADPSADGGIDNPGEYSLTVAVPEDGNLAFPDGQWNTAFIRDLNDPGYFPNDGVREIAVTAEDLAGNVSGADFLDIFIDTQGPQLTGAYLPDDPGYNLFDKKDSPDGYLVPTPLVDSLTITVQDLPDRAVGFVHEALVEEVAETPGHYLLVGDANGIIPISNVVVTNDPRVPGSLATATIVLEFDNPLPDDRYILTISDSLVDPVGNNLDGESNAQEPQDPPVSPTGDGVPGGKFLGRFTVDSRPEIGTWSAGSVYVDTNGNFQFDPQNTDATNRDLVYTLGYTSDFIFAGNFGEGRIDDGVVVADGFDKLAAYGVVGGTSRWLVDTDNDGVPNIYSPDPANIIGHPVAGNFDGDSVNGDEVGLFTGDTWWLDANHDFTVGDNAPIATPYMTGYPVVG
ncbi:MAG: Ig-like domain-containing protein, partial [Planctomycetota bacterium]